MKETTALVEILRHLKPSRMYPLDTRRTPEPNWVPAQTCLGRDPSGPNAWHPDIDTPTWWYPTQSYPKKPVVREASLEPRKEETPYSWETMKEMAAGRFYQEPTKRISRMPKLRRVSRLDETRNSSLVWPGPLSCPTPLSSLALHGLSGFAIDLGLIREDGWFHRLRIRTGLSTFTLSTPTFISAQSFRPWSAA